MQFSVYHKGLDLGYEVMILQCNYINLQAHRVGPLEGVPGMKSIQLQVVDEESKGTLRLKGCTHRPTMAFDE